MDHLELEQKRYANIERFTRLKEEAFRSLGRTRWDKGQPFEAAYSLAYHRLATLGVKPRLKKKYRVQ